jgi:hypothetical protein
MKRDKACSGIVKYPLFESNELSLERNEIEGHQLARDAQKLAESVCAMLAGYFAVLNFKRPHYLAAARSDVTTRFHAARTAFGEPLGSIGCLYRVVPTGRQIDPHSIECRFLNASAPARGNR